ncbi:MAG: hypothetical protein P8N31_10315 [Planctomycetota bacterium]|nr:hypothetical protein [Planctomycetota bacterium]
MKKGEVHVCLEGIDVRERGVFHTSRWVSVVQQLLHVSATSAEGFEPLARDRTEFVVPVSGPILDFWVSANSLIESKESIHAL